MRLGTRKRIPGPKRKKNDKRSFNEKEKRSITVHGSNTHFKIFYQEIAIELIFCSKKTYDFQEEGRRSSLVLIKLLSNVNAH